AAGHGTGTARTATVSPTAERIPAAAPPPARPMVVRAVRTPEPPPVRQQATVVPRTPAATATATATGAGTSSEARPGSARQASAPRGRQADEGGAAGGRPQGPPHHSV